MRDTKSTATEPNGGAASATVHPIRPPEALHKDLMSQLGVAYDDLATAAMARAPREARNEARRRIVQLEAFVAEVEAATGIDGLAEPAPTPAADDTEPNAPAPIGGAA